MAAVGECFQRGAKQAATPIGPRPLALVLLVVFFAIRCAHANDLCTTASATTTCSGDQSAGIAITPISTVTSLWLQSLTVPIAPAAGTSGISFQWQGFNGVSTQFPDGLPGLPFSVTTDSSVAITTTGGAPGILVTSTGGNGLDQSVVTLPGGAGAQGGAVSVGNGGSITTAGTNAIGISAIDQNGIHDQRGENRMQAGLAPLLMAALSVIVFFTSRLILSFRWSVLMTAATAFGTQIWSTASRAVWSQTWGIFILGFVIWLVVRTEAKQAPLRPVLFSLAAGARTPLFTLSSRRFARYSWFLRLAAPYAGDSELSGLVRLEVAEGVGLEAARVLADATCVLLPRFAPSRGRDPRAPQNLLPIGALESHLRHRLGDSNLVRRHISACLAKEVTRA